LIDNLFKSKYLFCLENISSHEKVSGCQEVSTISQNVSTVGQNVSTMGQNVSTMSQNHHSKSEVSKKIFIQAKNLFIK